MKYQEILERVGSFGRYQKYLCLLIIYAGIPNALVTLMFVYNHHLPEFRCKIPDNINFIDDTEHIPSIGSLYNATIPWIIDEFGNRVRSNCEMYNITPDNLNKSEVIPCRYGYEYDTPHQELSAVMEFDMVCENGWQAPFAVSIFMAGMMAGSTLGCLSDRFGRRCIFLVFTMGQFLFMGFLGFAWNFESYAAGCFFCGACSLINYVAAYVLSMEMVSPRYRNLIGIVNYLGYTLGGLLVPLLGYFLRNWRWCQWASCAIGLLYIPLYWITPESARWLIMTGKEEEAKNLLTKMAKVNGKKVDVSEIFKDKVDLAEDGSCKYLNVNIKKEFSLLFVLRHAGLRPRFFAMYFGWFVCALIYYGISLNPANLSEDRFLNLFLLELVEIPALIGTYYAVNVGGVPRCFLLFMTITGIDCIAAPFLTGAHSAAVTFIVITSKGAISAVYHVIYLGTLEISPTLVRNTATSLGSFMARLGGIASPYIIYAGSLGMIFLPYVIMGSLAMICGLFGILFLPENKGIAMPDTAQDALNNKRYYRLNICKKFAKEDAEMDSIQENISSRMI